VDKAGNRSENAATLGPIVVPDPTRPDTPIIRASAKSGTIGFYLQGAGRDKESERDKYEFTFSKSGGLNKTPWTEIPIQSRWDDFKLGKASYKVAPTTSANEGDPLILKLRAVNTQGIRSGISGSGPIIYDTSPPKTPTINLSRSGDNMTIDISNLHDPESGVRRVEYRVCDTSNYMLNCFGVPGNWGGWYDLVNYYLPRKSQFQLSKQVNISNLDYNYLKVFVRVTNRNGMQTTSSYESVPVYIIPNSGDSDGTDYNLNLNILNFNF